MINSKTEKKLMAFLMKKIAIKEDCEDLLQEVILAYLIRKTPVLVNEESFLFGICKNKVKEYYRYKVRSRRLMELIPVQETDDIGVLSPENLDHLSEYETMLFQMRFHQQKSIKEIALELNINYATLRWKMAQMIHKLKQNLIKE